MQLVALANDAQWNELAAAATGVEWIRATVPFNAAAYENAAAFFILDTDGAAVILPATQPVFLNSVTATLQQMQTPVNVMRINGWNGFLKRPLWEIAGTVHENAATVLQALQKNFIQVKDEPGLIAGRVVAMIINEAYFALGENVSDKAAIDTAMKLGTNYPYGPFEWAAQIGLKNIVSLLQILSETDRRYTPAPVLIKESFSNS